MDPFDTHGRIKCGTVATPDFRASLADYAALGLAVVDEGAVPPALAAAWGAPGHAGRRYAVLHGGGRPGYLRLVEGDAEDGIAPLTTAGWGAFEITVADVHALHAAVAGTAWRVIGEPRAVGEFTTFIPFQVAGRAGEVLYLNQVLASGVDGLELPVAAAPVDHMFIAVLTAADRAAALAWHLAAGFQEGKTYSFPVGVVNDAMGWPADRATTLTMTRVGSLPVVEIDAVPGARARPVVEGFLPPGCAMVSVVVDRIEGELLGEPVRGEGPVYGGRRVAATRGAAGEIVELIEGSA